MIKAKSRALGAQNCAAAAFMQAVEFLPMFKDKLLAAALKNPAIGEKTREIRLRAGQPVTLEIDFNSRIYLDFTATREDLRDLIELFCDYSLHSYTRQLSQGFITLDGGHRAGFCGTAVVGENRFSRSGNHEKVETIRDITSINLRIAREFIGCSDELFNLLPINNLKSLLIIGKPVSAKTTVLRDFARNLSQNYKVSVIDERGEIAAGSANLGPNTDLLYGFPKNAGFVTALRALSPDFIVCDEIADEGAAVRECLNCGVGLIMTAHCGSIEEALQSFALSQIIPEIEHIALLGTGKNIGKLKGLWCKNAQYENGFSDCLSARGDVVRAVSFNAAEKAGTAARGGFIPA